MVFDFTMILVIATGVSGCIVLADTLWQRSRDSSQAESSPRRQGVVVEYARSFFPILLLVLVVRSFLFEPFRIPSSSMMPTLVVGDFIFVNKFTYGLRLPVANTLIFDIGEPARGDVVVFRLPSDPSTNYIKRLVGLPGDKILYRNKRLYINGEPVEFELQGRYLGEGQPGAVLGFETLGQNGHDVLIMPGQRSAEGVYEVPPGYYFMMGDNRDNSRDSRYPGVGLIPESNVVGKAVRIWMSWSFPGMPKWGRIGNAIE